MHPIKPKWQVIYVLSNGLKIEHLFGTQGSADDHIKGALTGNHILRRFENGSKYTVYPASLIVEVNVERIMVEETRHHTGPSWNT